MLIIQRPLRVSERLDAGLVSECLLFMPEFFGTAAHS